MTTAPSTYANTTTVAGEEHTFQLHEHGARKDTVYAACDCGWADRQPRRATGKAYLDWRRHTARVAVMGKGN
jgi:hypothetical protein